VISGSYPDRFGHSECEDHCGPVPRLGRLTGIAVAVLAVALAVVSWIAYRATRPAELKPLVRLDVDLGSGVSLGSQAGADTIISPDGTRLVYVSQSRLFTRRLDQPMATELAGTEGAYAPPIHLSRRNVHD
jgi:hypothetical protein